MFHSLDDYRDKSKDESKDKDKRKTTDSYAGGKSSGISVENPEDEWMEKVRRNESRGKEEFDRTKDRIKLTIYRNGFVVDDGEFRPLTDPKNKKFMDQVEKGYIPQELIAQGYKDLGIELEDHKKEDYEPPKEEKKFKAFEGQGKSLGGVNVSNLKVDKNVTSSFDKNKPTCKVNIRLFNGEVVEEEFNLTQTLGDIIRFVEKKSGSNNFDLLDGFPPRPLTQKNKTIDELKLAGSVLTQKIK